MTRRPNVIVLILDSMRAPSMSLYGYDRGTTPCIDRFSTTATVYERAISPALWTIPAHASILTGLYPSQHCLTNMQRRRRFNMRLVTLPEALRRVGYVTAGFSENPFFAPAYGLDQGFSSFFDPTTETRSWARRVIKEMTSSRLGFVHGAGFLVERLRAPEHALQLMLSWMEDNSGQKRPVFGFANLLAPHFPWVVPPDVLIRSRALDVRFLFRRDYITLRREWEFNSRAATPSPAHRHMWRKMYDAAILHVDAVVGRFLEYASKWPGWNNTVVVITSDHGEMLGDYKGIVGHSLTMNDKLTHVPLIVRHPERDEGRRVPGVVQTVDLYRTILDWTQTPLDAASAGQVELPSLEDPRHDRVAITEEDYTDGFDVISRLKKLNPALGDDAYPWTQTCARSVFHKYVEYETGPAEFYDLSADPDERHNLIRTADPSVLRSQHCLQNSLRLWQDSREVYPPIELEGEVDQSVEVRDRLQALGYLS